MRRFLAPLEPDAFLRWAWMTGPREKGTSPLSLHDIWWEFSRADPECSLRQLHKHYIGLAARVRRNQRVGADPWEGIC